ncbi:metal-sulfur cluster assembly factor [Ligilactobacillus equi]
MDQEKLVNDILTALGRVIDPELGIDILNLGLIYDVEINEHTALVKMTLTTMGCPLSDILEADIKKEITQIEGIDDCQVKIVWYPVWTADKISEVGKRALGLVR